MSHDDTDTTGEEFDELLAASTPAEIWPGVGPDSGRAFGPLGLASFAPTVAAAGSPNSTKADVGLRVSVNALSRNTTGEHVRPAAISTR